MVYVDKLTGVRATEEEWKEAFIEYIQEKNYVPEEISWNFELKEVK